MSTTMSPLIAFTRGIRWDAGPFPASPGGAAWARGPAAKVVASNSAAADVVRHRQYITFLQIKLFVETREAFPPPRVKSQRLARADSFFLRPCWGAVESDRG